MNLSANRAIDSRVWLFGSRVDDAQRGLSQRMPYLAEQADPARIAPATTARWTSTIRGLTSPKRSTNTKLRRSKTNRNLATYDAIVLAVAHPEFLQMGAAGIHAFGTAEHVLYDVKSLLGKAAADGRL